MSWKYSISIWAENGVLMDLNNLPETGKWPLLNFMNERRLDNPTVKTGVDGGQLYRKYE
jgi:hypothetical protein